MLEHIRAMNVSAHKMEMQPSSPTGTQDIDLRYTASNPSAGRQPEALAAAVVAPESPSAEPEQPPVPKEEAVNVPGSVEETEGRGQSKEVVTVPGSVIEIRALSKSSSADETAIS